MLTSMLSFVKWALASLSISISPGTAWHDMENLRAEYTAVCTHPGRMMYSGLFIWVSLSFLGAEGCPNSPKTYCSILPPRWGRAPARWSDEETLLPLAVGQSAVASCPQWLHCECLCMTEFARLGPSREQCSNADYRLRWFSVGYGYEPVQCEEAS